MRLTTTRPDIARGVRTMVGALFARMTGEASAGLVMPPKLVVRHSA